MMVRILSEIKIVAAAIRSFPSTQDDARRCRSSPLGCLERNVDEMSSSLRTVGTYAASRATGTAAGMRVAPRPRSAAGHPTPLTDPASSARGARYRPEASDVRRYHKHKRAPW